MGPERRSKSIFEKVKGIPGRIGSIGDKFRTNNPISPEPELAAEAAGLGNVNIKDPKTANILQATVQGTPTQIGRPRTKPITEGRPTPDQKGGRHKVRNIVLGTLGAGAVLTSGGAALDHHLSANERVDFGGIGRDIGSIPGQVGEWLTSGKETESSSVVNISNSEVLENNTLSERYNASKTVDISKQKVDVLFPLTKEDIKDRDITVSKTKKFLLPGGVNPEMVKSIKGNVITLGDLPENGVLNAPMSGGMTLQWIAGVEEDGFSSPYTDVWLLDRDPETNASIILSISVLGGIPLQDIQPQPSDVRATPETGTKFNAGQPFIRLPGNFADAAKRGQFLPGESAEQQVIIRAYYDTPEGPLPLNIALFSSPDDKTFIGTGSANNSTSAR